MISFRKALTITGIELQAHRVSVSVEPHNELPQVFADRGQLQQVFQNLIVNAIEAMHAGCSGVCEPAPRDDI